MLNLAGNFGDGIVDVFLQLPPEVFGLFIGAAGVSAVTQVLKKWISLENDKVVMLLLISMAALASGIEYFLAQTNLPPSVLGVNTALIIGIATPLYHYAVRPLTRMLSDVRARRAQIGEKLDEIEAAATIASIPEAEVVGDEDPKLVVPVDTILEDELKEEPKENDSKFSDI